MSAVLKPLSPQHIRARLRGLFDAWIERRLPPPATTQTLTARATYILPTGYGVFFGFVLYCMLMGSINYSNSMGFLLTFLLAGLGVVGLLFTFRNLISLKLTALRAKPVFAGDIAEFPLRLETTGARPLFRIITGEDRLTAPVVDIPISSAQQIIIRRPAIRRGVLPLGRLKVWSEFPLGLCRVWSWLFLKADVLVYPKPSGVHRYPPWSSLSEGQRLTYQQGNDDFAGIRRYQPGDSPNHIAWKALARGHDALTKQFAGLAGDEIWLDWDSLPGLDTESRLSQLCQWVLDLHHQGRGYGLKLPGVFVPLGHGELHKILCLEKLALYKAA